MFNGNVPTPQPSELLRHPPAPELTDSFLRVPYVDAQDAREAAEAALRSRNLWQSAERTIASRVKAELEARSDAVRSRRAARRERRLADEVRKDVDGKHARLRPLRRVLTEGRRRFGLGALIAIPLGESILTIAAMDALYPDSGGGLLGTLREPAVLLSALAVGIAALAAVHVAADALAEVQQRRRFTPTDPTEEQR